MEEGKLNQWKEKIEKEECGYGHYRAGVTETGIYTAFRCMEGDMWGRGWSSSKQKDWKWHWRKFVIEGDRMEWEIELIQNWCHKWWHKRTNKRGSIIHYKDGP